MNGPASRRGFLSGLATLPLIGGSVALIGSPTAVAEPINTKLLDTYDTWLFYERRYLRFQRYGSFDRGGDLGCDGRYAVVDTVTGKAFDYVRADNAAMRFHDEWFEPAPPSTRAALVLGAVGCQWRRGDR